MLNEMVSLSGKERSQSFFDGIGACALSVCAWAQTMAARGRRALGAHCNERGQATTEYAILVGVLVVMAIIAIALFRPRLQELWNAIAEGINSL